LPGPQSNDRRSLLTHGSLSVGPLSHPPDGSGLIAAYDTGRAYLWDIQPASLIKHACQVAGRQLTRAEWDEALPGRRYDPAC